MEVPIDAAVIAVSVMASIIVKIHSLWSQRDGLDSAEIAAARDPDPLRCLD